MVAKRKMNGKGSLAAKIVAVACASCVLAGIVGFGVASARNDASHQVGSLQSALSSAAEANPIEQVDSFDRDNAEDKETLANQNSRDISQGVAAIAAEEEAARAAEEEAARLRDQANIEAAEAARASFENNGGAPLADVDWSVGKDAFVAEWTQRIDNYLAGSPLAGQGAVFAEAAWAHGVDPRWSPAISNTESTKGAACFRPYNAWGWMSGSQWGSWEESINAHVSGLAEGYGYSITPAAAQKYCPPTYMDWYNKTLAQMQSI